MSLATTQEVLSWLGLRLTHTMDDDFIVSIVMSSVDRMFADFLGYSPAQATRTEYYPASVRSRQVDPLMENWERSGTKVVPVDRYQNERRIIGLRHTPVRSIVSVYENPDAWLTDPPDFGTDYLLTAGTDYYLDQEEAGLSKTGFLTRATGPWTFGERSVKVTYIGGYSPDELAADYGVFRHAYLLQCQVAYNTARIQRMAGKLGSQPGLLSSESLGDWAASYDTASSAALYSVSGRLAPGVAAMLENYLNYSTKF